MEVGLEAGSCITNCLTDNSITSLYFSNGICAWLTRLINPQSNSNVKKNQTESSQAVQVHYIIKSI